MYNLQDVKTQIESMALEARKHVDLLAELDGLSGDGDLGETIGKLSGVAIELTKEDYDDIGAMLKKMAMAMNKAAPSTLGTLISSGVLALAKATKGKSDLTSEDIVMLPRVFADAIQSRGGATVGDKTILDALCPMADKAEEVYFNTGDLQEAMSEGGKAAIIGAESTRGMVPKAGRAKWIGERVRDNLDGGAVLCAKVVQLFVK